MRAALVLMAAAAALNACAANPNVKGSWACETSPGVACASIEAIDRGDAPAVAATKPAGALPEGASKVFTAAMTASPPSGAPYREADPVMKIILAPWVDASGDYHGTTEVFAVMRRGRWWQGRAAPAEPASGTASASAPSASSAGDSALPAPNQAEP